MVSTRSVKHGFVLIVCVLEVAVPFGVGNTARHAVTCSALF